MTLATLWPMHNMTPLIVWSPPRDSPSTPWNLLFKSLLLMCSLTVIIYMMLVLVLVPALVLRRPVSPADGQCPRGSVPRKLLRVALRAQLNSREQCEDTIQMFLSGWSWCSSMKANCVIKSASSTLWLIKTIASIRFASEKKEDHFVWLVWPCPPARPSLTTFCLILRMASIPVALKKKEIISSG